MKIVFLLSFIQIMGCGILFAQEKTFIKEYTYKAGEMDSKISCRAIAVNQLRSTLLQEIGVYVESEQLLKTSEVSGKFSQDFIENIATISAGITKLEVLEEKWNGETFWMKAAITVDPKSLEQSLKQLVNDRQKVKELETLKKQLDEAKNTLAILTKTTNSGGDGNRADTLQRNYNKEIGIINATEFIYSGTSKYNLQDFIEAIIDFNMAIHIDPNYAEAYLCRGISRDNLREYWAAIADFTKAIEINPRYAWTYYNRGVSKSHLNDNWGAIADYAKAIEIDPNYSNAYNNRGVSKTNLHDNRGAIEDFTRAIQIDPNYSEAYNNRGVSKNNLHEDWEAIDDFTKAIEIDPSNSGAYMNRGFSKAFLKDYLGAIRDYNESIKIDPNFALAYVNRGASKHFLKDYRGAIGDYDIASGIDPNDSKIYFNRGIAKQKLGQRNSACLDLSKAEELGNEKAREAMRGFCQ